MKSKDKTRCKECNRLCTNIYGPYLDLCRICFNKGKFRTNIPNGPLIFDQELSVVIQPGMVSVTEDHAQGIEKRLDYLFPGRRKDHRFSKMTAYLRLLIINDLGSQKTSEASKK